MICASPKCEEEVADRSTQARYCSEKCRKVHNSRLMRERVRQGKRRKQISNGDELLDTWIRTPLSKYKSRRVDV